MSIPFLTMGTAPTLRSDGTEEPIGGISDKISNLVSNTYNKFFSKKPTQGPSLEPIQKPVPVPTPTPAPPKPIQEPPPTPHYMPPPAPAPAPMPPPMTTQNNSEGIAGKFVNKLKKAYNKMTDGIPKNNYEHVNKMKERLKWAWDNKTELLIGGGEIAETIGNATDNKYVKVGAKVIKSLGESSERIDNKEKKKELEKKIGDVNNELLANYYLNSLNYPRIHYSRKPSGYKIYQGKRYRMIRGMRRRRKARR